MGADAERGAASRPPGVRREPAGAAVSRGGGGRERRAERPGPSAWGSVPSPKAPTAQAALLCSAVTAVQSCCSSHTWMAAVIPFPNGDAVGRDLEKKIKALRIAGAAALACCSLGILAGNLR